MVDLDKYFRKALGKYRTLPDWEDAVQEAHIFYWANKDKFPDEKQRRVRASLRGKAVVTSQTSASGGVHMLGHVGRRSTEGVRQKQGDLRREKIRSYMAEFKTLHGREPTLVEVARGTGISRTSVNQHIKKMRGYSGGSIDPKSIVIDSYYAWDQEQQHQFEASSVMLRNAVEWEESVVAKVTVRQLLSNLTAREQEIIFMHYWQDISTRDIAKHFGVPDPSLRRWLTKAYAKMRKVYESN